MNWNNDLQFDLDLNQELLNNQLSTQNFLDKNQRKLNTGLILKNSLNNLAGIASGIASGPLGWIGLGVKTLGDNIAAAKSQFDMQGFKDTMNSAQSEYASAASNAYNTSDLLNLAANQPDLTGLINSQDYQWDGNILSGIGAIFGKSKTERDKKKALAMQENLRGQLAQNLVAAGNQVSNIGYRQGMSNYLNNAAMGGPLSTHGSDFTDGLIRIDNGGTHESNPYGGVPAGMDPMGIPNLVEEGETIWDNGDEEYVFSRRLKTPKSLVKKFSLGGGKDGLTYAEASKKIAEKSGANLRPNDPISKRTKDAQLAELEESQEEKRMKIEQKKLMEALSQMSPEQLQGLFAPQPEDMQMAQQVPPQGVVEEQPVVEEPVGLMTPGMAAFGGHLFYDGGLAKRIQNGLKDGTVEYDPRTRTYTFINENGSKGTSYTQREFEIAQETARKADERLARRGRSLSSPISQTPAVSNTPIRTRSVSSILRGETPAETTVEMIRRGNEKREKIQQATQNIKQEAVQSASQPTVKRTGSNPRTTPRTETRPNGAFLGTTWDEFLNELGTYSPSRTAGGVSGTYAIDRQFPFAGYNDIKALEGSDQYRAFTDYILNNSDRKEVQDYLKTLDRNTPGSVEKLFNGDELSEGWKTLYNRRRNDGLGGIYHFSGTLPTSNSDSSWTPNGIFSISGINPIDQWRQGSILYNPTGTRNAVQKAVEGPIDTDSKNTVSVEAQRNKMLPTWMRYAPVIGGGLSVLSNALSPEDYSDYDNLLSASRRLSRPVNIPVVTIGDRIRRNPIDERLAVNQANQNFLAGIRGTMDNAGGNRAYRQFANNLLAYNNQGALSDIATKAYLANRQDALQTADFNRGTAIQNMNAINQRNLTQAQLNSNREQAGWNALAHATQLRDAARRLDDQYVSADFSGLMESLGNIGRENEQRNWLTSLANEGLFNLVYGKNGELRYVPSVTAKCGGKVKTKKRRF